MKKLSSSLTILALMLALAFPAMAPASAAPGRFVFREFTRVASSSGQKKICIVTISRSHGNELMRLPCPVSSKTRIFPVCGSGDGVATIKVISTLRMFVGTPLTPGAVQFCGPLGESHR